MVEKAQDLFGGSEVSDKEIDLVKDMSEEEKMQPESAAEPLVIPTPKGMENVKAGEVVPVNVEVVSNEDGQLTFVIKES